MNLSDFPCKIKSKDVFDVLKYHTKKVYGGEEVKHHTFLILEVDVGVANLM